MKVFLVIPRPVLLPASGASVRSTAVYRLPLRWTVRHPSSSYGKGVLLADNAEVFDAVMFRYLRDRLGAWLECPGAADSPARVAAILGVPWQPGWQEPGIGAPAPGVAVPGFAPEPEPDVH